MRKLTRNQKVHPYWRELGMRAKAVKKWSPKLQREHWVMWRPDRYPHDSAPYKDQAAAEKAAERVNKILWP